MEYVSELKVLLAKNKMTQKELAQKSGIAELTVGRWCKSPVEKGDIKSLLHICNVLKCQPGDIIKRSEQK